MNRKMRGFTIVELLVVMAIISILAAIVVPNAIKYIAQGRMTKALGDIKGIELALVKMVADADRSNLNHLFNADNIRTTLGIQGIMTRQQFEAVELLYTRTIYALLREGRAAITDTDPALTGMGFSTFGDVLNQNVVKKLGTSYLEDIAKDPWGNIYQIWPGPWKRSASNPIPFRIYLANESSDLPGTKSAARVDVLTFGQGQTYVDPETNLNEMLGYSAPTDKIAYIWSYGANLQSSQAIYNYPNPTAVNMDQVYDVNQGDEYRGGGDDINNWDNGQSWKRFYN